MGAQCAPLFWCIGAPPNSKRYPLLPASCKASSRFLQTLLKRYSNAIRDLVDAVGASLTAFPA